MAVHDDKVVEAIERMSAAMNTMSWLADEVAKLRTQLRAAEFREGEALDDLHEARLRIQDLEEMTGLLIEQKKEMSEHVATLQEMNERAQATIESIASSDDGQGQYPCKAQKALREIAR